MDVEYAKSLILKENVQFDINVIVESRPNKSHDINYKSVDLGKKMG